MDARKKSEETLIARIRMRAAGAYREPADLPWDLEVRDESLEWAWGTADLDRELGDGTSGRAA